MFTTPCFIKVNETNKTKLKDKLRNLGYKADSDYESCDDNPAEYLVAFTKDQLKHHSDYRRDFDGMYLITRLDFIYGSKVLVDCGTNESLFLAIAALRDDNYYMQHLVREDPIIDRYWSFNMADDISDLGISLGYRRATIDELKEHFKE